MKEHKTECDCNCHFGVRVGHWQYGSDGYQPTKCSCTIKDNPNFVPEEIRKTWK